MPIKESTTMNEMIFTKLRDIMVDELGLDEADITPNALLIADLNVNSLEFMNVILAVEEEFDIELDENGLRSLKTVGDVVSYIEELRN